MSSFYRFAFVGSLGFLVDLSVYVLFSLIGPHLLARAIAFWCAASSNWYLNRRFTFASQESNKLAQWSLFLLTSLLGFVPNMGVYYLTMQWGESSNDLPSAVILLWPYISLVPGVLAGLVVNFLTAKYLVFRVKANLVME